jgi:hypothetical protein
MERKRDTPLRLVTMCALGLVASQATAQFGPDTPPVSTHPSTQPASAPAAKLPPGVARYQPGIRIDWHRYEVQVDATVVLRKGLIELFACSPRSREYESIVRIDARPLYLYQALGLIGLTPGHPIRFKPGTEEVQQATGDAVEVDIRYSVGGRMRQEPVENWMRRAGSHEKLSRLPWVFAGSVKDEQGGYTADVEGTVLAVVDFNSSLVALPEHHSDRNDELWLEPSTDNIPPEDTPCVLIFRAGPLRIDLDAAGRIQINGRTHLLSDVARIVGDARKQKRANKIQLSVDPKCPAAQEQAVVKLLRDLKVPVTSIAVTRPAADADFQHDPQAASTWLRNQLTFGAPSSQAAAEWAESPRHLARDLHQRTAELQARTEAVVEHASKLSRDVQQLLTPATAPAAPDNARPGEQ